MAFNVSDIQLVNLDIIRNVALDIESHEWRITPYRDTEINSRPSTISDGRGLIKERTSVYVTGDAASRHELSASGPKAE
ncbi:hypothetical protein EVAR_52147_1 [Eumeta japonica]|uniref:Uncharacterized protein n=1 Tax=Eumeta variegata TaxID=151549 RepID=A0A4C2A4X1_EUMVA|nr:hypothetical protein EVAR_52147_1 [Eumeta japonica]